MAYSKASPSATPESHFMGVQLLDALTGAPGMRPMTLTQYRAMQEGTDAVPHQDNAAHSHRLRDRWDAFRSHH